MSGDSIDVLPESQNILRRSDSQGDVSEFSSYSRRSSTLNNSLFGLGFRRNRTGPYLEGNLRLYDTM